jgi:hypothetical protein
MRRGTTCKHTFRTNLDLTNATVFVTYQQGKSIIIEKTGNDLVVQARKITVNLTQEDTLSFAANMNVNIQIRYILEDGTADASNIITISVQDVIKDGEIAYVAPNPTEDTTTTITDTTGIDEGAE